MVQTALRTLNEVEAVIFVVDAAYLPGKGMNYCRSSGGDLQ